MSFRSSADKGLRIGDPSSCVIGVFFLKTILEDIQFMISPVLA